jgi:hypothetical protein|tara:strand:+ start:2174 stop:2809 length:636 start_codon:yes stop_codon:yes gene_type:complete
MLQVIILGLLFICILTVIPISVSAQSTPDVKIIMTSEVFHYGEKLDYTIIVSDVTGYDAVIYIIDSTGIRSPLYSTPISQEETHVIAPIGFDSVIWNDGEYSLELEYSGAYDKASFTIVDDGSVGIPYWINDLAKLWLSPPNIPDKEFAKGIVYLIEQKILDAPDGGDELYIPKWFKFTTAWWAYGQITDTTYANAIQFLIDEKILVVVYE